MLSTRPLTRKFHGLRGVHSGQGGGGGLLGFDGDPDHVGDVGKRSGGNMDFFILRGPHVEPLLPGRLVEANTGDFIYFGAAIPQPNQGRDVSA